LSEHRRGGFRNDCLDISPPIVVLFVYGRKTQRRQAKGNRRDEGENPQRANGVVCGCGNRNDLGTLRRIVRVSHQASNQRVCGPQHRRVTACCASESECNAAADRGPGARLLTRNDSRNDSDSPRATATDLKQGRRARATIPLPVKQATVMPFATICKQRLLTYEVIALVNSIASSERSWYAKCLKGICGAKPKSRTGPVWHVVAAPYDGSSGRRSPGK
jgi:hypothetical protein